MNRRTIGITIIVLAGILLLFIIYVIFFKKFDQTPVTQTEGKDSVSTEAQLPKIEQQQQIKPASTKPKTPEEMSQDELRRLAMLFAERFGSFSNQSTYQNVTDLQMFMTEKMKTWAQNYVESKNKDSAGNDIYYGITTRAATAEVKSFDAKAGTAEINVGTQRRESTGTTNNASNFGQILVLKFKKENGAWRIDEARWQEKKLY